MKDVLKYIISAIVESPDKIDVQEQEDGEMINLTVTVAKEDMGRVIGKNGKIIRSIRNVMKIPALKREKKVFISLVETPQE